MKFNFFEIIITCLLIFTGCKEEIINPPVKDKYTTRLQGKVILQNQSEHSNALVYIDSLNRGVSTDSNGSYYFIFTKDDTVYNGVFKIYYFVYEYEIDSAQYFLEKGKVKLDTLDVDSEGNIAVKQLKQLISVEGWTDKQEYRIGDTLDFTARFTNVSDRTVHLKITSFYGPLGGVGLYNEKYMPIVIGPCDPVMTDWDNYLSPGNFYEGRIKGYTIRDRNYCVNDQTVLKDEYIVITNVFIEDRLTTPFKIRYRFEKFVIYEWYKIHRGKSPKYDFKPNKCNFPPIKII